MFGHPDRKPEQLYEYKAESLFFKYKQIPEIKPLDWVTLDLVLGVGTVLLVKTNNKDVSRFLAFFHSLILQAYFKLKIYV